MKPRLSKPLPSLSPLVLAALALTPPAYAQTPPSLAVQFTAGQPTLSLTGTVGTVYSIQYATDLSATNVWMAKTLLQAQGTNNVWTDPTAPTPGQRFYRAVSAPA